MFDPKEVLVKSLESLTPGGSEFSNDPERCIAWIKDRLATVTEQVKKRQQAEADNAALVQYLESLLEYESIIWMHGYIKDLVNKHHPGAALLERLQQALELAKVPVCQKCDHAKQYTQGVVLESWCEFNRRRINPYLEKAPTWCPLREEATDEASDKV